MFPGWHDLESGRAARLSGDRRPAWRRARRVPAVAAQSVSGGIRSEAVAVQRRIRRARVQRAEAHRDRVRLRTGDEAPRAASDAALAFSESTSRVPAPDLCERREAGPITLPCGKRRAGGRRNTRRRFGKGRNGRHQFGQLNCCWFRNAATRLSAMASTRSKTADRCFCRSEASALSNCGSLLTLARY